VSVVMANYQGGRRIRRALDSVRNQTLRDIEIIVSDDASSDDSAAIVREIMQSDDRIRLIVADRNGGPARSRNRALDAARGQWIAIVDSDDIIHPERFERLIAAAAHFGADIVADDLLHFHDDGSPVTFLLQKHQQAPFQVSPQDWVLAGIGPDSPPLGYMKPMIKASAIGAMRYDETLRIGEDYDLMLRILLKDARFYVIPEPWYLYRRHTASISHRLSVRDMALMIESQSRFVEKEGPFPAGLAQAFNRRMANLKRGHDYEKLVEAIKARSIGRAATLLARQPRLLMPLWRSFTGSGKRAVQAGNPGIRPAIQRHALYLTDTVLNAGEHPVPSYSPPGAYSDKYVHRHVWETLANRAADGELKVVCDGAAGLYAAGFIPADRLDIVIGKGRVADAAGYEAQPDLAGAPSP
jgi:succinoglycan biosynthesis protein ExoO